VKTAAELALVFLGGFATMVLEVAGVRFLARYYGGEFYVWISQIGMVMAALAAGYYFGGWYADRAQKPARLLWLLTAAGIFTITIPWLAPPILTGLEQLHLVDNQVSPRWQKLGPAVGSALLFFLPCFVLASLSPFTIRLAARHLDRVGRASGSVYAASTIGSILGVFLCGYFFLNLLGIPDILRATGVLTLLLGGLCWYMNRFYEDNL
jgi:MFS family permease